MKSETISAQSASSWRAFERAVYQIYIISAKEIYQNIRNFRIFIVFIALAILFILSMHILALDYQERLENSMINQRAQQDPVIGGLVRYDLADGSFFYSVGAGPEAPVALPHPLSVIVKGANDDLDRAVAVGQRIGFGPRENENTLSILYNTPDALFIIKLLVSLLALFFSLDVVTREKEAGTLRTLLSLPLSRRNLILGKAIGAAVSLFLPFALVFLIGIVYLYTAYGFVRTKNDAVRILLVFALSLLYGLLFALIGTFISTITSRTKVAVVLALLAWEVLVFVLPAASVIAARILSPAPSYNELNARLYQAQKQIVQAELQAHPGAKTIFDTPNAKQVIFRILESDRQLTDDYIKAIWSQVDRARDFGILSPAGALSFGSSDVAGTGTVDYRLYTELLQSGRDTMINTLKQRWELPPGEGAKLVQEARKEIASRQYQPQPLSAGLRDFSQAVASLLAWIIFFGWATYKRVERYDVR
jgi:ABC-type transport system involved in multi-copper enzyme maturation permease subunit